VDLRAVKSATGPQLAAFAIEAAANARGLLEDAKILADADRKPRAYCLAVLAVEECGKAAGLTAMTAMPDAVRAQALVGRMLEWHQFKQVGGMLLGVVTYDAPGAAHRLAAMKAAELTQLLGALEGSAEEADRLKRRGFYVDMNRRGRIRGPSEISDAEVAGELAQAGQAVSAACALLDPAVQARMAKPPAEAVRLSQALVSALAEAGDARTPEAAAEVMLAAVTRFQGGETAIAARDGAETRRLPGDPTAGSSTSLPASATTPRAKAHR